ncbi:hypothetical protein N7456_006545 [Penicillium angulare]|uniref:DUF7587 domain-containing protein n=1 Tax=Penicillium angulare TaxID=116970 RepID=A0A9W9FHU6_9EURO|nr:hypothetical protein N7456_006545 [Penicillium angulare]
MTKRRIPQRYGVKPVQIVRRLQFVEDPPFTEQEKRENENMERLQERYNGFCQRLIDMLDDKIFLAESLGLVTSLITGGSLQSPCSTLEYNFESDLNKNRTLPEMNEKMQVRLADSSLTFQADITTLHALNNLLLSRASENYVQPEPNTPEILYRAFRTGSYSRFDKDLGFRSSRQPLTPPSNYDGPLEESSLVTYDILKNHCEGTKPSDLIAMSDSPARILKFVKAWDFKDMEGNMIAVINVSKLLAMRVLFNRTTTLCKKLGIEPWSRTSENGLSWVNRNYWVAYRWVPAECIEFCISIDALQEACNKKLIGK